MVEKLDSQKTNDITNEASVVDQSSNTVQNSSLSKMSTDITKPAKKDLSFILQQAVTKKKLENIQKQIDKKMNESVEIDNEFQQVFSMLNTLKEQYYNDLHELKDLTATFNQKLQFYGIADVNSILSNQQQIIFLHTTANELRNTLSALEMPAWLSPEQRTAIIENTVDNEQQKYEKVLNELYLSFMTISTKQNLLQDKAKEINPVEKDMKRLQDMFKKNQERLIELQKKYEHEEAEWFLKSHQISWPNVSLDDFISNPRIEKQLKRLITLYNHQIESKKLWLPFQKSILFVGDHATWKTFAAKVLASEINRTMYHIQAHDLSSEDESESKKYMLSKIFSRIIEHISSTRGSCIIFLDGIERIVGNPSFNLDSIEITETLLANIINIQKSDLDIIVVGAIDQKNMLDDRFMKYNLFENQFFFDLPSANERERLFAHYIDKAEKRAKLKIFDQKVIPDLVKATDKFSPEFIKQLIESCLKEYNYLYLQHKHEFAIQEDFIWGRIADISATKKEHGKPDLTLAKRKQILNKLIDSFTMKSLIFWALTKDKKDQLLSFILDRTEHFTENELTTLINECFDEYTRRKANYHRQSLIGKEFILEKIQELKEELARKWSRNYFNK